VRARPPAGPYVQTNLISNLPGLAAIQDSNLINPWGVANSATSPFWVSNQGNNTGPYTATLYSVTNSINVSKVPLTVAIPTTTSGPQGPTGQVFNNTTSFPVNGAPAHFIFANLNGTISAWNQSVGTAAQLEATTPGAIYTGLAIGANTSGPLLYAANTAQNRIDVFNGSFAPVALGAGAFANPFTNQKLVPFNVQNIGGDIYVTYAPAGRPAQIAATAGEGGVAIFDQSGNLIRTLISGSQLASPWGITFAPSNFGEFANDLLVGNFSYALSEINAFDPTSGAFLGTIPIDVGAGNTSGGLWALDFGVGGSNGSPDTLYFTDGIDGETAGLFGAINVPEPSGLAILSSALALFGFCRAPWRWRRPGRVRLTG
jgi:uncharacterized protein (TIGR03118 family)